MVKGRCRLCLKYKNLMKSHIIPNAVFRRLKKEGDGKLIEINTNPIEKIHYTSDSWWEYLLCDNCEKKISKYESYGLSVIRG